MVNVHTPAPGGPANAPPPDRGNGPPPFVDPRDRPRTTGLRNGAIVAASLAVLAFVFTLGADSVERIVGCSRELASIATAQARYRSEAGDFGDARSLVDAGFLGDAPRNFAVTVPDGRGREFRIRGTGRCDGFDLTQNDRVLRDS